MAVGSQARARVSGSVLPPHNRLYEKPAGLEAGGGPFFTHATRSCDGVTLPAAVVEAQQPETGCDQAGKTGTDNRPRHRDRSINQAGIAGRSAEDVSHEEGLFAAHATA